MEINPKHKDDELLMLSGIQHIAFCPRQWAMIHIEQQWFENLLTTEGKHLHEIADNPFYKESNNEAVTWRSVNLVSYSLGLSGRADVVEFRQNRDGLSLEGRTGKWMPYPVEYKRGKPKPDERDEAQLCAQAICLEEMFNVQISEGALFYGETRRRTIVPFTYELRNKVCFYAGEMHRMFQEGITPSPVYKTHCKSCSLFDICLPKATQNGNKVTNYLKRNLL